jgi:uncharacterized repeat protein (TIGR01451 family)
MKNFDFRLLCVVSILFSSPFFIKAKVTSGACSSQSNSTYAQKYLTTNDYINSPLVLLAPTLRSTYEFYPRSFIYYFPTYSNQRHGFASNNSYFSCESVTKSLLNKEVNSFFDAAIEDAEILVPIASKESEYFHLFSHGKPGQLFINGIWMDKNAIATFLTKEIGLLSREFEAINIYGCDFGFGEEGKEAIAYLEKIVGKQIYASTNLTGLNGDWDLEIGGYSFPVMNYKHSLQLDKVHYLPPFVGGEYSAADFSEEEVVITTNSPTPISVAVADGSGVPITGSPFSVVKGTPVVLNYPTSSQTGPLAQPRATLGTKYTNKGLVFSSSDDFAVSYRSRGNSQADIVSCKGQKGKGKHFKWAVPRGFFGHPSVHSYMSVFAVEAATVSITGINPDTEITGVTHNGSITVTLNAGESIIYEVKGSDIANISGHVGADILSTGDIVINTGGQNAQFLNDDPPGVSRDHCIDQIIPIEFLGLEHIVAQANGGNLEKVFVTATTNNTSVFVNGSSTPTVLNAGQQFIFTGSAWSSNGTMYLESTQPIYVQHVLQGRNTGGLHLPSQGMVFISPLSCFASTEIDEIGKVARIGTTDYVSSEIILIETVGATTTARQNGNVVSLPLATSIIGNSQYQIRKIPPASVSVGSNWSFISDAAIFAYVFGTDNNAVGFASYVSSFPDIPVVSISGNTTACGNNTFEVTSGPWSAYQWYKDGVAISGATSQTYFATDPADYSVEVFFGGSSSCSQFSSTVVNPCPGMIVSNTRIAGPSPVTKVGDVLTYEVSIENTGNVELTNLVPTFFLADNSSFILSNPTGDTDNDGLLDPGETWVYTVTDTVTLAQYDAGITLTTSVSVVTTEIPGPTIDAVTTEIFNRPTNLVATKSGSVIVVSFTPGTNGGRSIVNYEYSSDNGNTWIAFNPVENSSPVTISGLSGSLIVLQLRAVNDVDVVSESSDPVVVPGGVTVVQSGGDVLNTTWTYISNTISPNSSVDVNLNVADLLSRLSDPLTVEGLFITINTPVEYAGSNALTLKAISGEIAVNEPVDVNQLTLIGKGVVASGAFINADGALSLSDSLILKHGDKGFSQLRFTGAYTGPGPVSIEQKITGTGWHNLANPFINQTAASFGLVGTVRHPNAENLRRWNATATYIWENIGDGSQNLDEGRGYLGYFGNHPQGWEAGLQVGTGPWILNISGTPLVTTSYELQFNVKVANTTWEGYDDPNETDGWNFVANPFTAVLDFSKVTKPTNTQNAFYIWDPNKSGGAGYVSWSGAGITEPYIAPLQSYWVQTDPTFNNTGLDRFWNLSMAAHTDVKTATQPRFFKDHAIDFDRIVLRTKKVGNAEWADHTVVALIDETTNGYDSEWDARKWMNPGEAMNIYSVFGNTRLANNAVSYPLNRVDHKSIPIGFSCTKPGLYEIVFDDNWMINSMYLQLEDLQTGTFHNLVNGGPYQFQNDSQSTTNRFVLHIGNRPIDLKSPTKPFNFWVANGNLYLESIHFQGRVSAFANDLLGRDVWRERDIDLQQGAVVQLPIAQYLSTGTYMINIVAEGKVYSLKFIK